MDLERKGKQILQRRIIKQHFEIGENLHHEVDFYIFLFGFLKNTVDRLLGDATTVSNRLLAEVEAVKSQNLAILGYVSDLLIMNLHRLGAQFHYKTFVFKMVSNTGMLFSLKPELRFP